MQCTMETLRRRVTGAVDINCKPGPTTVLDAQEEEKIASYVVKMADMEFGLRSSLSLSSSDSRTAFV